MDMSKKAWLGIPHSILLFYKYAKGCKKIYHDFITYKRNPLKSLIKMKVLGEHYNNGTLVKQTLKPLITSFINVMFEKRKKKYGVIINNGFS